MDVSNLRPERSHIDDEVFDDRQILQRRDADRPTLLKFLSQRRAAGKFLGSVNLHRTGTANRGAAGVAQRETPVALVLDADQRIEHR
jgi:hypothetical protein